MTYFWTLVRELWNIELDYHYSDFVLFTVLVIVVSFVLYNFWMTKLQTLQQKSLAKRIPNPYLMIHESLFCFFATLSTVLFNSPNSFFFSLLIFESPSLYLLSSKPTSLHTWAICVNSLYILDKRSSEMIWKDWLTHKLLWLFHFNYYQNNLSFVQR